MRMLFLPVSSVLMIIGASAALQANPNVDIPYERFALPNGLTVVVHEDHKAPVVAVNMWYHVGSKNEAPGKTGFAHLFEHLMFQGSENYRGEFFELFERVGSTEFNGTTNKDRTNYFENVPTTALDAALWVESDRMGHLLGAIDQPQLDEQRGVVQNEKRQSENQPYGGRVWSELFRALYPEDHPYAWPVIGRMEDLDAATLADVKDWFRRWYGPNNAVLVLAGDINLATAKEKVARYFGDIPASVSVPKLEPKIPTRSRSTRATLPDRVPQPRIYRAWSVAQFGSDDSVRLGLVAHIFAGSKNSRLSKRLVHEEKLADNVSGFSSFSELSGNFVLIATVKPDADVARVEQIIDEELRRFLEEGPSVDELEQARTARKASFIRGIERVGGFGGKSDVLAACQVFVGDPGCFRKELELVEMATPALLKQTAVRWLSRGEHTLVIEPSQTALAAVPETPFRKRGEAPSRSEQPIAPDPKFSVTQTDIDRSKGVPTPEQFPDFAFPALQRSTLSNGIKLVLAERHDTPVVQLSMEFKSGFAADVGHKLGTSSFTMEVLDEGAGNYSALGLAERADALGASISTGANLDLASVYLSALKEKLEPSLALYSDVIRRPRFEAKEIERARKSWIAGIRQEKSRPNSVGWRLLPPLMYGDAHPYAVPFSGTGSEESIGSLVREDLLEFHRTWLRPDNATLIVVGDTSMGEIKPLLEKHFANWEAPDGALPKIDVMAVDVPKQPRVYLVDQPGALQATIMLGQVVPSTMDERSVDFDMANGVLGGEFGSRLNMKLREEKHWSYGAYSSTQGARGQRPWVVSAPVQLDKTVESLRELEHDIAIFASGEKAATSAEIAKIKASSVRSLPGRYETANAVLKEISSILRYQLPDDYVLQYRRRVESLSDEAVLKAAATIRPGALTWLVVGDLSKIEQPIRNLKLGEVSVIDADGKKLR